MLRLHCSIRSPAGSHNFRSQRQTCSGKPGIGYPRTSVRFLSLLTPIRTELLVANAARTRVYWGVVPSLTVHIIVACYDACRCGRNCTDT